MAGKHPLAIIDLRAVSHRPARGLHASRVSAASARPFDGDICARGAHVLVADDLAKLSHWSTGTSMRRIKDDAVQFALLIPTDGCEAA